MPSVIEILKDITKKTNSGTISWESNIDGVNNKVLAEEQPVAPNINTQDNTYFAFVKMNHDHIVPDSFSAKIISAGEERQSVTQSGGGSNLNIQDTGSSTVKIVSAKLDNLQGTLMLKWNGCNIQTERSLDEDGNGVCRGNPSNENAHKIVVDYEYQKFDSNVGNLGQIYTYANTPWADLSQGVIAGPGMAVINSPRGNNSLIKTLKIIFFEERTIKWMSEPESSSSEGKELANLFNAISKQTAQPIADFIGYGT